VVCALVRHHSAVSLSFSCLRGGIEGEWEETRGSRNVLRWRSSWTSSPILSPNSAPPASLLKLKEDRLLVTDKDAPPRQESRLPTGKELPFYIARFQPVPWVGPNRAGQAGPRTGTTSGRAEGKRLKRAPNMVSPFAPLLPWNLWLLESRLGHRTGSDQLVLSQESEQRSPLKVVYEPGMSRKSMTTFFFRIQTSFLAVIACSAVWVMLTLFPNYLDQTVITMKSSHFIHKDNVKVFSSCNAKSVILKSVLLLRYRVFGMKM